MSSTPAFTASGLASGIDTASIIQQLLSIERQPITTMQSRVADLKLKNAQYGNVAGRASTLLGTVKGLKASSAIDVNHFQSKKATLSKEGVVGVAVDANAAVQSFTLKVNQMATATKALGQSDLGQRMTDASILSEVAAGAVTNGTFTLYVNGIANTINVDTSLAVDDVLTQIEAISGITAASVVNGQIQIDYASGTTVQVGSHQDTSNFARVTQLATATPGATQLTGLAALTLLDTAVDVSDPGSGFNTPVTDGTFVINGQTFDTTGKTLDELVAEINTNPSAEVTASINRSQNRLELRAKDAGNPLIQLADGTGNFLTAVGLIVAGNSTVSQTPGQNAEFELNGQTFLSTSNTVGSDITGLSGVTLTLQQVSTETITSTVGQNLEGLKTNLNNLVTQLNNLFALIDDQTNAQGEGKLKGESSLVRFRNELRNTISNAVPGLTQYDSLATVGLSTGAVGTAVGASKNYVLDVAKLEAAMQSNPTEVENLFRGSGGILSQVQTLLEAAVKDDPDPNYDGLFESSKTSVNNQIKSLNDKIAASEQRLQQRETLLRQQFQAMETAYSRSQAQQGSLTSLINQLSNSNK
ncbi:MAG: flagellar filament capping protein FliD [Vampirovibrionales bacterium]